MKEINKLRMKVAILFVLTVFTFSSFAQEAVKTKNYQGIVEFGGSTFFQSGTPFVCSADFINGFKFTPTFFMGLGVGIRFAPDELGNGDSQVIPLYGCVRINLLNEQRNKVYPYIQSGLGVMFVTRGGGRGAFFHQSFGIGFKNSPVSIGLCGELISIDYSSVMMIGLNLGFSF